MAEASGIRAGKAFVELSLQDKFSKALDAAAKKLKAVGESITDIGKKTAGIGAAITAPLLVAAQRFAAMGSEINDAAGRTGLGVVALQELKFAADLAGTSMEDVETATKKMQKAIVEAADGSKQAQDAFAAIGVTVDDLKDLAPEDQFALIADRINAIKDPAQRTAAAMDIFGKSGANLIPMFDGLADARQRAHDLGVIFDPKDIAAADTFGDTLDELWKQINAVVFQIGAAVASALQPFAASVERILRSVIDWCTQNRSLIVTVLTAGAALVALGGTLVAIGAGVTAIGFVFSAISGIIGAVGAAIGFLVSPIGLTLAALAGLAAYFLFATQSGGKALAWLGNKFDILAATTKKTLGGMGDALAAGDLSLAAEILWTGLKLAWVQGTQELQDKWSEFKAAALTTAAEAFYGILAVWQEVKNALGVGFVELCAMLGEAWLGFTSTFKSLWATAQEKVFNGYIELQVAAGKMDRKTADAAKSGVSTATGIAQKSYSSDAAAGLVALETAKNAARTALDVSNKANLAQIQKDLEATKAGVDTAAASEIDGLEKKRQGLIKQLEAARAKAKEEHDAADTDGPPKPKKKKPTPEDIAKVIPTIDPLKTTAQGLFNAAGLQSLQGAQGWQTELVGATKEVAKNTKETNNTLKDAEGMTWQE